MKIEKIVDKIPNLDKVVDNEKNGIEVHAEMPVVMADAYNDSIIRRKIIEKNFKESDKLADDFIERNHKRDGFKMQVFAPLKKLKLSESLFNEPNESLKEAVDLSKVAILAAENDPYTFKDSAESSCTVGELIDALGRFRDDTPVILGFDKRSYGFYSYGAIDPDRDLYNSKSLNIEESLKESDEEIEVETDAEVKLGDDAPAGPEPNEDTGMAGMLIDAINDEWKTIDKYNSIKSTCASFGDKYVDFISVIDDIVAEENVHVGQLQKTLETISPNVEKIAQGEKEAEEQIDNTSVEIETKEEIIK